MRKINIGAGATWREEGWEVLDNGIGSYSESWKHKGKCWDSGLSDKCYDVVFTSHMLEHIPHFRLEKTIAEFNRIMKTGGTLRILVPHLRKYATAYVNGDKEFFSGSKHYSDHLGIGGSFVRILISPGQQTLAMSREMDEVFGGYAHLYSFDFEMMKALLEKWGFGEIVEQEPGGSAMEEMQRFQHLVHDGQVYELGDQFLEEKKFLKSGKPWHFTGFDKRSDKQLVVEAVKVREEPYALEKEFDFNRWARADGTLFNVKLALFRAVSSLVDICYDIAKKIGLIRLVKIFYRG